MHPQGPLAQLTQSRSDSRLEQFPLLSTDEPLGAPSDEPRARLGSPFMARSYGPSSSNPAASDFVIPPELERQTRTVGAQRSLQSPVRLTRSRSNTQKRRSRQAQLEPHRKTKRPSLDADFWTKPSSNAAGPNSTLSPPELSSTTSNRQDDLFVPRTNLQGLFETSRSQSFGSSDARTLAQPMDAPARLGSPFFLPSSSFSFPNRFSHPTGLDIASAMRRPFATVQQPTDNNTPASRPSLATRLAYIDERLKDLRRRDPNRRRSESPL